MHITNPIVARLAEAALPVVPVVRVVADRSDAGVAAVLEHLGPNDPGQAVVVAAGFVYTTLYGKRKRQPCSTAPTTTSVAAGAGGAAPTATVLPDASSGVYPPEPVPAAPYAQPAAHVEESEDEDARLPVHLSMATPTPKSHITLHVRPFDGVAHTLNPSAATAEVHLSSTYLSRQPPARLAAEIWGVLVHELVHAYQGSAHDTAPGGLIEGVADYVRLRAGLAPPHWRRKTGGRWDGGYDVTAYFLDWIERAVFPGFTRVLNGILVAMPRWDEQVVAEVTGHPVGALWDLYQDDLA
ncbi:hypothetical protein H9P43_009214 [Blastocladiella emersonii ATCC 22665]|nr:hypothetical protein H9P43_009214 [Blastocladiella emersonii ATCC 22665]